MYQPLLRFRLKCVERAQHTRRLRTALGIRDCSSYSYYCGSRKKKLIKTDHEEMVKKCFQASLNDFVRVEPSLGWPLSLTFDKLNRVLCKKSPTVSTESVPCFVQ